MAPGKRGRSVGLAPSLGRPEGTDGWPTADSSSSSARSADRPTKSTAMRSLNGAGSLTSEIRSGTSSRWAPVGSVAVAASQIRRACGDRR